MIKSKFTETLDLKVTSNKRIHHYFGKYRYAVKVEFPSNLYYFSYHRSRNCVTSSTFTREQRGLDSLESVTAEEIAQYQHAFDDLVEWVNTNRSSFRTASFGIDHVIFYLPDERMVKELLSTLPEITTGGYKHTARGAITHIMQLIKRPRSVTVTQATGEPVAQGVIALDNPAFKFRTFFNSVALSEEQRNQLCQFLSSRSDLKLSTALTRWAIAPARWNYYPLQTLHWFSVDHNDQDVTLLLELIMPGVIRKTAPIVKRTQTGECCEN